MRSISALGVRSVRRSAARYLLTAIGATLGVAVLFGVLATNASISDGIDRSVGSASVPGVRVEPIGSYGNTIPAPLLDQLGALPGVSQAWASVFINATVAGSDTELNVLGHRHVEGPDHTVLRARPGEAGRFEGRDPAPGADEISLSRQRASELGVSLGDPVELVTRNGPVALTVVRIGDWPDSNGLTSFETASRIQGQGDVVQSMWVELAPGTSAREWAAQHAAVAGDALRLQVDAGDGLRNSAALIQGAFGMLGLMAAFVGGFLIYLTMSTSVAERTRTWGVLRAVGARRRDVVRAVLGEAAVLGVVATTLGLVVGAFVGTVLLRLAQVVYNLPRTGLTIESGSVITAIAVGLLTPPAAAFFPAWRAAKAEPVDAMRERHTDPSRLGPAWLVGAALVAAALVLQRIGGVGGAVRTAPLLFLLGAVLLVPVVLGPIARLVGKASSRLAPGLGDAAVNHLVRERTRSAYTLGLLMVVLALVLTLGGVQGSLLAALDRGFEVRYRADVTMAAWNGMPDDVADAVRDLDGVGVATAFRSGRTSIGADRQSVELAVIETDSFFGMQGFPWSDGDDASARAALEAGNAVIVPEVYARRVGVGRGDALPMQTTQGLRDFTVAGIYATPETGVRVIVGLADGVKWFGAGAVTGFELKAAEGVTREALRAQVEEVVGDRPGYWINTMDAEHALAQEQIRQNFRPFLAVIGVAAVVGMLGLANTLGMTILRRTREIGILRAVGIQRGALGRMVLVESLTMGAVAFVLSIPLGWVLARAVLTNSSEALGFSVPFAAPTGMLPALAAIVVVIAGAASVAPARRIARLDPVTALRFE